MKNVFVFFAILIACNLSAQDVEEVVVTKKLYTGWNLIGFHGTKALPVEKALTQIWEHVEMVKNMDAFYAKDIPGEFNLLDSLFLGEGYYVLVTEDCLLQWKYLRYNYPPATPVAVFPADGATGVETNFYLKWESSDPEDDKLSYTVLFDDIKLPLAQKVSGYSENNVLIENLEFDHTYYWQVDVLDEFNHTVKSEVFSFTTESFSESQTGTVDGTVTLLSGNCMPMIGEGYSSCNDAEISTKLVVTPKAEKFVPESQIDYTYSDWDGAYSFTLPEGEYTVFVVNTTGMVWKIWSEYSNGWDFTITKNQNTTRDIRINNATW